MNKAVLTLEVPKLQKKFFNLSTFNPATNGKSIA